MIVASKFGAEARIPIGNIWYVLLYAFDFAEMKGRWKEQEEASPTLLALLARVLADAVADRLRVLLGRTFISHRESIRGIRGRVDMAASLRRMEFEAGRAHCAFPQLDLGGEG